MIEEEFDKFISEFKIRHEVFHDLMQFKIREVLLIATIYDAYILEQEDLLSEKVFGEYYQLYLTSAPRITSVNTAEKALKELKKRKFDIVILTLRIDKFSPFELTKKIRRLDEKIPIILLLNDNTDIALIETKNLKEEHIDRVFVWNGDSKIFLAINKYIEDKFNVCNDTKIGMVRVILLVEDSVRYYSRYLPVLCSEIIKQTQRLITEEHLDESKKLLRMRSRPKILMAETFEEAVKIIEKFKDYLLCVISDIEFPRENILDNNAGIELIKYVKNLIPDLPTLLQSSEGENQEKAFSLHSSFINKNSETLSGDLKKFILSHLGFGDFIFRDSDGREINRAKNLDELKELLTRIPNTSLIYHSQRNHFSSWLMARGEIRIAKSLQKVKTSDFMNIEDIRNYLINICNVVEYTKRKGKIINFDDKNITDSTNIVRLSGGSLGGKGRGIAFLNSLILTTSLENSFQGSLIRIPNTVIIGTESFDYFMEDNGLFEIIREEDNIEKLRKIFSEKQLPNDLIVKLKRYLNKAKYPLAVRSSGIFEDSLSQPFSGLYNTYIIPNNHPDIDIRLKQLTEAIKMVYASVYSKNARTFFEAVNYKIEEEKMSIVLQKVVGNEYGSSYYPHFSGVAQSYNYYPISYIKPEDGIAVIAVGLGTYVVEGEKSYRFCPKHPKLAFESTEDLINNTQVKFASIDMTKNEVHLLNGEETTLLCQEMNEAAKHKTIEKTASVWDWENDKIFPGIFNKGQLIINFAQILKYRVYPLAEILQNILHILKYALGTPVEIEFAVDLEYNPTPTFYLLQVKPLVRKSEDLNVDIEKINKNSIFINSQKALGNGKITGIYDLIYVNPDTFDKSQTVKIAEEINLFNEIAKQKKVDYILMGPGRWGTRDPWLGIPVKWSQISQAKTIIEHSLKDFRIDPSLGSHFFHNIISMNIGYFSIPYEDKKSFINWQWLKEQKEINKTEFLIHVKVDSPITILMDGRKQIAVVYVENK